MHNRTISSAEYLFEDNLEHTTVLAIAVTVAEESPEQLDFCLQHVTNIYPDAAIVVISDGSTIDYSHILTKYRCTFIGSSYIKRIECGGMWWHRIFSILRQTGAEWLLKIDPDTRFKRRIKAFYPVDIQGSVVNPGVCGEYIQGGCQIFQLEAVEKILKSGILGSESLTNGFAFCPNPNVMPHWVTTGYFSTDWSLMWIIKQLGLTYCNNQEIGSRWRVVPTDADYAVEHPYKFTRPVIGVPEDVPINLVVTCKGRLSHLQQTLPGMVQGRNVFVTVVDYDCPEQTAQWVAGRWPNVKAVQVRPSKWFNLARARNIGAAQQPTGWIYFVDADLQLKDGWASAIRSMLEFRHYFVAAPTQWGLCGSVVVHSDDFKAAGGYDELYQGWGCEDTDFYTCLRVNGVRPASYPKQFAESLKHGDDLRTQHQANPDKQDNHNRNKSYYLAKRKWMVQHNRIPMLHERLAIMSQITGQPTDVEYEMSQTIVY